MSLSTIAAARQKEMNASMAVVATSTRGAPDILLCCDAAKSFFIKGIRTSARSSAFRSSFRSRCGSRLYTSATNPAEHTNPNRKPVIYTIKKP